VNILDYNPWWQKEPDLFYQEWFNKKIKWIPKILNEIPISGFSLNFITGPRQVGKTTALKIFINRLLKKNVNPFSIFYCPCDELLTFSELGEVLDQYLSIKNAYNIKLSYIILDEISFVKEWWRAIKIRIDSGKFKNDVIIISGSSSVELLKEKERFPGRRGTGKDLILYPLNFGDFVELFIHNLKRESLESFTSIDDFIAPNLAFKEKITELFNNYLITGGFPLSIQDFFERRKIRPEIKRTYLDWIRGDIIKSGKNEISMKEVISYLLQSRCTLISWLSISKSTSINSPHTVQSYIDTLESLFIIKILYHLSPDGKVNYRKNKKIHFIDPFLYSVLSDFTNIKVYDEIIVESIVASHLSRIYPTFYWRNSSEVDIISIINNEQIGFEIKWGPKKWKKPLHIKKAELLKQDTIPLFLASCNWSQNKFSGNLL